MSAPDPTSAPRPVLGVGDGVALMVGMVVGIGVFKAPSLVVARIDDPVLILLLWVAGGLIVLVGALCYAELASAFPDAGGEYHFLRRAFGPATAFLFAWGRLTVVQTGAIAAVAFVLGDYAQQLYDLGPAGPPVYAALAVVALSALNIRGTRTSARVQNALAFLLVIAALGVALLAFLPGMEVRASAPAATAAPVSAGAVLPALGFAMIFVMLTYGGWNEAAYLSGELGDVRRNMVRVVGFATAIVAILYLMLNTAYLHVLGPAAMRASNAVGADYVRALLGAEGAAVLSGIIVVAALSTLNATIFTGARSLYAAGRDTPALGGLGRWNAGAQGPVNAHLAQAALALALIGVGTMTRQGFATMVEYTAPVFWFFLLLSGVALFVLRARGLPADSFRVPFYPLTPALFCLSSAFMLYSAIAYTGFGALLGIGVVALGLPVWLAARRRRVQPAPLPSR